MAGATEARGGKEPRGVQLDKAAGCSRVHALPVHSHGEKPTCQRTQLLRRVQIRRQFVVLLILLGLSFSLLTFAYYRVATRSE